jgi:hypothetical protein
LAHFLVKAVRQSLGGIAKFADCFSGAAADLWKPIGSKDQHGDNDNDNDMDGLDS